MPSNSGSFGSHDALAVFPRVFRLLPLALGLLGSAHSAGAALIAYEGFDSAVSTPVHGSNFGFGFTSAWNEELPEEDYDFHQPGDLPRLAPFETLQVSGTNSARSILLESGATNLTRSIAPLPGTTGSVLWASFLVRKETPTSTLTPVFVLRLASNVVGEDAVQFGDPSTAANVFAIGQDGAVDDVFANSTISITTGQTAFLVAKISFLDGPEKIELFVNPTPGLVAPLAADATKTDLVLSNVATVGFYGSSLVGREWSYDEVRLGAEFADVAPTPEPTATLMLASGFFCLGFRRIR